MDQTRLIHLLSQYPIAQSIMGHLKPSDLCILLNALGSQQSDELNARMPQAILQRLVRCDNYGSRTLANAAAFSSSGCLHYSPRRCSAGRRKACSRCGWATCRRCAISPRKAAFLLGQSHYGRIKTTLCAAQTFMCTACRPLPKGTAASGVDDAGFCSCTPNPLVQHFGRGRHVCMRCFEEDVARASLGRFSYEMGAHRGGYFLLLGDSDRDGDGGPMLPVANCSGCETALFSAEIRAWCVFCGGLARNRSLDDANAEFAHGRDAAEEQVWEDDDGGEHEDDSDEWGDEDDDEGDSEEDDDEDDSEDDDDDDDGDEEGDREDHEDYGLGPKRRVIF